MLKYYLGAALTIPLLPILYVQGKKIKSSVPNLPPARDPNGVVVKEGTTEFRVLLVGESTFAGVGVDRHENGFAGAFARSLSDDRQQTVRWEVQARNGYTADRVRTKILPKLEDKSHDLLVVGLGGNDAFGLHSPRKWQRDVEQLIDDLQEKYPNTPIVFANMPPIKIFPAFTPLIKFVVGNLVELLGESLAKLVARRDHVYYNEEVVALEAWGERYGIDKEVEEYFSDGVHPAELTYQVWGQDLAAYVQRQWQ